MSDITPLEYARRMAQKCDHVNESRYGICDLCCAELIATVQRVALYSELTDQLRVYEAFRRNERAKGNTRESMTWGAVCADIRKRLNWRGFSDE